MHLCAAMDYQQTIDFLYEQLPMFSRIGAAAYKKDLHNTLALLEHIGNPHLKFKSIHIAGTNGKGSTSHMMAAVMQANGYKTGLYTSPHLKDFRERIKVNGVWIDQQFVIDFTERMKPIIAQLEPSFFELTVAMAFEYFSQQKVDIAIIETGMGGRLDSTNVITPELSIITNIGYDHIYILGNTLEAIAFEKAGIIKANTPVVIGESTAVTKPTFLHKATEEKAPIFFAEEIYEIKDRQQSLGNLEVIYDNNGKLTSYTTDLAGIYQQYNLRTALTTLQVLQEAGWQLLDEKNRYALSHVKKLTGLGGRWELIHRHPNIILDVAHNEDGIRQVIQQLQLASNQGSVHVIMGMAKDKEVEKVLALLPVSYKYYFTNAHIPRALPAAELQQRALAFQLLGDVYDDVNDAIATAAQSAGEHDLIIVCGSVFVVGEVEINKIKWQ
jgi:dihydrofolate synthase/folylpolyglutamate synthase